MREGWEGEIERRLFNEHMRRKTAILILLVVVLTAVSVYASSRIKKHQSIEARKEKDEIATSSITIETNQWQTYRNDKYRFQIQYPGDWRYYPASEAIRSTLYDDRVSFFKEEEKLAFYVDFKATERPLEEYLKMYNNGSVEKITLRDLPAAKIIFVQSQSGPREEAYFFKKDATIYVLAFWVPYTINDSLKEQILSTFKFIE